MGTILDEIRSRAKADRKRIAFPEFDDERVVEAVKIIEKEKIAYPLLLTKDALDPKKQDEFAQLYYERNKAREITLEQSRALMDNPIYYGAMMSKHGLADGFVAGAKLTSSAVIKAALGCLDIDKSLALISSCFIMVIPNSKYGEKGALVYADCGVIPYPSSDQLATIAISAARFADKVLNVPPRVAFLSFSTKGSAEGRWVDKIKESLDIVKSKNTGYFFDGELQADAAIVPEVAKKKLSTSDVAGRANVLIFPNLDAGNICYKLTERLTQGRAIGPILLGTLQPCSDLSRGCSVDDVVDAAAVTAVRAQKK